MSPCALLSRPILSLAILFAGGLSACELEEVAAPASTDVLVVEAVLRVGAPRQHVLLHRSLENGVVGGEPGASISVSGSDGSVISYEEADLSACVLAESLSLTPEDLQVDASCYVSSPAASALVRPGERYDLQIETIAGETVRGRTEVPGAFDFTIPSISVDPVTRIARCSLPNEPFPLTWTQAEGSWSYIISLRLSNWGQELRDQGIDAPDPLQLTGVSVSAADTSLLFPDNLSLFQRGEYDDEVFDTLQDGVPVGSDSRLVVLAIDRNYTNAVRGGQFNPSGNVRLSSVVGDGVGLFGSAVPLELLSVAAPDGSRTEACPIPPRSGI